MSERLPEGVNPDFSIMLNYGERQFLINRAFDNIHLFHKFGFAMLKIVDQTGFLQICVPIEDALAVAEASAIKPLERDEISESEYRHYQKYQEENLSDDILSDVIDLHIPDELPEDFE